MIDISIDSNTFFLKEILPANSLVSHIPLVSGLVSSCSDPALRKEHLLTLRPKSFLIGRWRGAGAGPNIDCVQIECCHRPPLKLKPAPGQA